ncbi:MAG: hypothetical protein LBT91_03035 [Bifidobacteriaceae bacterium]|jgi:hypothetical protein|nr:hypothetical protein [Bifidobacteriaceae bacterium]
MEKIKQIKLNHKFYHLRRTHDKILTRNNFDIIIKNTLIEKSFGKIPAGKLPEIVIQDIPDNLHTKNIVYFTFSWKRRKGSIIFYRLPILNAFSNFIQLYNLIDDVIINYISLINRGVAKKSILEKNK